MALSRLLRTLNPGNILYGPFARKYGSTGADATGFAIFPTLVDGLRAQAELLIAYAVIPDGKGGLIDTVEEAISRWCPPTGPRGESKAATEAYIRLVCEELECNRDDEFDFTDPNFLFWIMTAQGEMEQGHDVFTHNVSDAEIQESVRRALA